eukprot:gene570-95_t
MKVFLLASAVVAAVGVRFLPGQPQPQPTSPQPCVDSKEGTPTPPQHA